MNPWFVHPVYPLASAVVGSAEQRALPSNRLQLRVLGSETLVDVEVPRGYVDLTLLSRTSPYPWPDVEEEIDANAIAVGFEERGAVELPRYEPWGLESAVDAVVVRVGENETRHWDVLTIAEQPEVGPVVMWIADSRALGGVRALQDVLAPDGRGSSFYVRRVTEVQQGVGIFTHSALDGLFLNVAQQRSSIQAPIDGRARLWTGRDRVGLVTELVIDLAAVRRHVEPARGVDPWLQPVFGGLTLDEHADLSSLLDRSDPFWVPAYVPGSGVGLDEEDPRVRKARTDEDDEHYLPEEIAVRPVGSIPLAGDLMLGALPRANFAGEEREPVKLGLTVEANAYPVFVVEDREMGDSAYLVRFDVGLPVRWSYVPGVADDSTTWLSGVGVVLFTSSTPEATWSARPIEHHPIRWSGEGSGALIARPRTYGHTDPGVFEVYVGYDESDLPVAILLDTVNMVASEATYVTTEGVD